MSVSDPTYLAAFGGSPSVLERVLLAIINAHTTSETEGDEAERLQMAMMALIGPAARDEQDLERALLFMVRQRQKDICDLEMCALRSSADEPMRAPRSVSELASLAAREVMGCKSTVDVQATASVLCAVFRNRGTACNVEQDYAQKALETEAVQRLCAELAEWDVPIRL
jgi:hypothetical protein